MSKRGRTTRGQGRKRLRERAKKGTRDVSSDRKRGAGTDVVVVYGGAER